MYVLALLVYVNGRGPVPFRAYIQAYIRAKKQEHYVALGTPPSLFAFIPLVSLVLQQYVFPFRFILFRFDALRFGSLHFGTTLRTYGSATAYIFPFHFFHFIFSVNFCPFVRIFVSKNCIFLSCVCWSLFLLCPSPLCFALFFCLFLLRSHPPPPAHARLRGKPCFVGRQVLVAASRQGLFWP